jgi:DNA-binding MarR family transcriptional regulator
VGAAPRDWGRLKKFLSPSEFGVLDVCSKMPGRLPTERQTVFALEILERLEKRGFVQRQTDAVE